MHTERNKLSTIEIDSQTAAIGSIIWLHGLGADGNDFVPIVPQLELASDFSIRFIFPNAPSMPVTINNGYVMPAWFDIYGARVEDKIDYNGIQSSIEEITKLIEIEKEKGIAPEKIILAGFSQGAVIALATALQFKEKLGGVIALSGYLPPALLEKMQAFHQQIPIFLAHGTLDNIVPYRLGEMTRDLLFSKELSVEWHSYAMAHSVCHEEIQDISSWVKKTLSI